MRRGTGLGWGWRNFNFSTYSSLIFPTVNYTSKAGPVAEEVCFCRTSMLLNPMSLSCLSRSIFSRHNVVAVHALLTRFARGDFADGKADFAWTLQVSEDVRPPMM